MNQQTIKTGNGVSDWLKSRGFTPSRKCKDKIAGVTKVWTNAKGQKAIVGYCLYSRTGLSSRGSAAVWGYTVTV